jgi:hypothetical protein
MGAEQWKQQRNKLNFRPRAIPVPLTLSTSSNFLATSGLIGTETWVLVFRREVTMRVGLPSFTISRRSSVTATRIARPVHVARSWQHSLLLQIMLFIFS